MLSRSIFRK